MMLERLLRAAAVAIAILGLVDPALTLPWRKRPIVGVVIARPSAREGSDAASGTTSAAAAQALQTRVVSMLNGEFDARASVTPPADAAAVVLVGDGRSPVDLSLPTTTVVSAVVPAPNASDVHIVRVDAPRRTHISARVPIAVQLDARGLAGRTSIIVVRSDGLELARRTHTWRDASERAILSLDAIPLHAGLTRYAVAVLEGTGTAAASPTRAPNDATQRTGADGAATTTPPNAVEGARREASAPGTPSTATNGATDATPQGTARTRASAVPSPTVLSSADVAVDIREQPRRVLFVNARPSWATQFIRRALEDDPRFAVVSATRVSRGVTATTAGAPVTLAAADPDTFHAIVVGAPELLTKAEVDTLRTFARVRGGVVIVAPDRRPEGPVLELIPARDFTERLLAEPTELLPVGARSTAAPSEARSDDRKPTASGDDARDRRAASAETGGGDAEGRLWATELAVPRDVLPGTETLLSLVLADDAAASRAAHSAQAQAARSSPIVMASPLGDGVVIVSGALDAWRYRDRGAQAFDRFWRETIAARAQAVPEPVEVTLEPAVARPGDHIEVTVRVRTMTNSAATAAITPATAVIMSATARDAGGPTLHAAAIRATLDAFHTPDSPDSRNASDAPDSPAASAASGDAATTAIPVRLWPDSRPGAYHGVLNAPSQDGVYAVSVQLDGEATTSGRAALSVDDEVHVARPAWAGLQAFVDARHGQLVTADHLDRLGPALRDALRSRPADARTESGATSASRHARHPLRSAWWIVPFAACLGGEWLLRRRRGAR